MLAGALPGERDGPGMEINGLTLEDIGHHLQYFSCQIYVFCTYF